MAERLCPECGGKVTGRKDKIYCDRKCRDKNYRSSEDYKAQKKLYREKYRSSEKYRESVNRYRKSEKGKEKIKSWIKNRLSREKHERQNAMILNKRPCLFCGSEFNGHKNKLFCSGKCQNKNYRDYEKFETYQREYNEKNCVSVSETYVRRLLGMKKADCPPELIELKRQQILLTRAIKKVRSK